MKIPVHSVIILWPLCWFAVKINAQSYHALDGSPYAGVTSMYNNPASTVNQAFNWDVTLFSLQFTTANTAFLINNGSLTNASSSKLYLTQGMQSRYFHNNADLNLLNARFKIDRMSAFAFGIRLRTYNHAEGQPFYYSDTISTVQSFLHANNRVNYLDGFVTSAAWAEFNFNYSRVLVQSQSSSLSAGATLAYMKGLSGFFADVSHVSYLDPDENGNNNYTLTQGGATTEYSANYQVPATTGTSAQNVKNFIKQALPSTGLNLGVEYLFKDITQGGEAVNATNYDWKISASIMDIGRNKFNPIGGSFSASNPKQNVTDTEVQNQTAGLTGILDLWYKMHGYFKSVDSLTSRFTISLPTRMVISVDRNLGSNFYVDGQLSLNFYSVQPTNALKTRELNLLTLTPRWETAAWGFYMPVQYNTQGMFWVGAAVKLGPLLIGVHSLDFINWFKTGTQNYNGGGYILLSIHPFGHKETPDKFDCPSI